MGSAVLWEHQVESLSVFTRIKYIQARAWGGASGGGKLGLTHHTMLYTYYNSLL